MEVAVDSAACLGLGVAAIHAPPWITVTAPHGPMASPATFEIAVNTTAFAVGTMLADDVVFATTRGNVERTATIHVSYRLVSSMETITLFRGATIVVCASLCGLLSGWSRTFADLAIARRAAVLPRKCVIASRPGRAAMELHAQCRDPVWPWQDGDLVPSLQSSTRMQRNASSRPATIALKPCAGNPHMT
jgi:hypothetical protein